MTARVPLYEDSTESLTISLKQMSAQQISAGQSRARWEYARDPSVTLSYVASGGNLPGSAPIDRRLTSGGAQVSVTAFVDSDLTEDPQQLEITYARINQTLDDSASTPDLTDTSSVGFPAYYDADGNIRSMTKEDFYDTYIRPAVVDKQANSAFYGNYSIRTGTIPTGYTNIGTVFIDTVSDLSEFDSAGIGAYGTIQSPTGELVTEYKLAQYIGSSTAPASVIPIYLDADGNIVKNDTTRFAAQLKQGMRYAIRHDGTYRLRYLYSDTDSRATTMGSLMTDTLRNGDGRYVTQFVGLDDYRSQEFPSGTPVTNDTYKLSLNRVWPF